MTTNIEDGIEFRNPRHDIGQLDGVGPEGFLLLEEFLGHGVLLEHFDGARVQWGFATGWGGDYQLGFGVKDVPGVGKFGLYQDFFVSDVEV